MNLKLRKPSKRVKNNRIDGNKYVIKDTYRSDDRSNITGKRHLEKSYGVCVVKNVIYWS